MCVTCSESDPQCTWWCVLEYVVHIQHIKQVPFCKWTHSQ